MNEILCCLFLVLAPLAGMGLALIDTGLGRSRSAAQAMMAALCATAVSACAYFAFGHAWMGFAGSASHSIAAGGKPWDWLGAAPAFFGGLSGNGAYPLLTCWMGLTGAAIASLIPLGSGLDRWRLGAICASTALLAGWTFPLFAHWAWSGGWLAQLGSTFGLGDGYLDPGGAGTIHVTGGLTALAIAWILGPRRGKYSSDGMPLAIPGHNAVLVLFGCSVAFVGWVSLNCAGAILFVNSPAGAGPERIATIALNTTLTAAAAALAAAGVTRLRYGKPDASLTANGWTGGLVASSAAAAFLAPATAVIAGLMAGALVAFSVEILDLRLEIDDPGGSVSVHAVGGIWGVLALGLLGRDLRPGQLLAQVVGIATLIGVILPVTWGLNWLLDRLLRQRVSAEGEHQGMDLYELGAGAYPEFMTHSDDFMQR